MSNFAFWLRWSWRDLRERWILVGAIALTIGVGTGAYAGLTSTSIWRINANDASYAALRMFDVRARITDGSSVPAGQLTTIAESALRSEIAESQERLVLPTQVDASTADATILVPGQIIGVDVADVPGLISGISLREGRLLTAADANHDVVALDYHFAKNKNLPPSSTITIADGHQVTSVGQILTPEYFLVTTAAGGLLAESNFAAMVAPLDTVQRLTGRPGQVNDIVIRLAAGVDADAARDKVEQVLERQLPGRTLSVHTAAEDDAQDIIYKEIDSDQEFYAIFAFVILGGATLAAFNLTSRIVESHRRQIGISMALGLPRRWIAFRPILVGAQVALLGVALGMVVGNVLDAGMDNLLQHYFPLPVWSAPFQPVVFLQAALVGFLFPFVASLYPVWRAVSVPPIQAIRTGFLSARSTGWAPLLGRVHLPGGPLVQMPLRNVFRTPRRTFLTALGVGAAVTVFVGTTGLTDTMLRTIAVGQSEVIKSSSNRISVTLSTYQRDTLAVGRARDTGTVADIEPQLVVPATAKANGAELDISIEMIDMQSGQWAPTITRGVAPRPRQSREPPQIVLSEAGAAALGVRPGDLLRITYPLHRGNRVDDVDGEFLVSGLQPDPLKFLSYMNIEDADVFGLGGRANRLSVIPAADETISSVQRAMFDTAGVVSVEAVDTIATIFRNLVEQYLSLLTIVQATALALALLIAFNSATIAIDERSREHATMFAFGTPLRVVLTMAIVESAAVGVAGTAIGLVFGRLVLELIVRTILPDVVPDIGFVVTITPQTVLMAAAIGVGVVGLAPLLGTGRLRSLNIPNALRVVE
jgi:putative ABC transport system permease protein